MDAIPSPFTPSSWGLYEAALQVEAQALVGTIDDPSTALGEVAHDLVPLDRLSCAQNNERGNWGKDEGKEKGNAASINESRICNILFSFF